MPLQLPFYRRLSVRLLAIFLLITTAILSAITFFNLKSTQSGYEKLTKKQFQATLKGTEDFISQTGLATETWAQHFASEPEVIDYISRPELGFIQRYIEQYDHSGLLTFRTLLLDNKGRLLFDLNNQTNTAKNFSTTNIFLQAIAEADTFTAILHDGNQFTLFSASPVSSNENIIGVVLIGKVLDSHFINQVSEATGVDITIVRERAVMASTLQHHDKPIRDLPIPYLEYQHLLDNPGSSVVRTLWSEKYFLSAKPLKQMDGKLAGSIFLAKSHHELNQVSKQILNGSLRISLVALIAVLFSGILIFRFLGNIQKLLQATVRVTESGELAPVEIHSKDETGILARNFNRMLATIEDKSTQLQNYSSDLEAEVDKRTSQLKLALQELDKFSLAVQQSPVGVVITDLKGNVEYVNTHFSKTTGYSEQEIKGKNLRLLKSGYTPDEAYSELWKTISSGQVWRGEFHNKSKDGSLYWERTAITPIRSEGKLTHYLGMKEDISAYKEYEQTLLKQANFDSLTNLPNRVLARDRLKQAIASCNRHGHKGALLFIDLDNFKRINDTLGHDIGDKLLIEAGHRIANCIREEDTTARLSGDEFLVIIGSLNNEHNAETVARHIIDALSAPIFLEDEKVVITASIGITLFPDDSNDLHELMRYADTAMYRSKALGKNRFCFFTEEMNSEVTTHLRMENALRDAIENNKLELYFQPLTRFQDNRVYGAEALLRWNSDTMGSISPAEFIPLAEESDLIHPLGRWVLTEACSKAMQWRKMGYPDMSVAVNISPRQFQQGDLVDIVADTLTTTGLPAANLEIEITEGALLHNTDKALETLNSLRALGISLAIDDFGTGYSSLSYLSQFPFDILKIDKSFIDHIIDDKSARALTTGMIDLAHNLEMKVVSEGVEEQEQYEFLRVHGCDHSQGFLLSKPLPYESFVKYLHEHPTN